MSPQLDIRVIEDQDEYRIITDSFGITKKERKTGTSTPLEIEYPIKSRRDFHAYKEHYTNDYRSRLPQGWDTLKKKLADRDFAIRLGGFPFGFFGFPRHLIGTKELYLMMYDDPELIKEINEFFLNFAMDYWEGIILEIHPDFVLIWEDMAGKTGSLISNEMFKEFMSPYYIRFIDYFKQHGIENIHVDSDGYVEDLLPLWAELGVTGLFPFERQAGNDILRIRKNYPHLQILGGVDKRVFTEEHTIVKIDEELKVIEELLKTGGFIPHADHHVPDDACWKNFKYYRLRLNDLIDKAV
jgi:uroporphyrinogen decarboxylase